VGDHIFISYAREDQTYLRKLVEELHRRGFETWVDDRIDYGDRWWKTIEKAVHYCAAFVVIMTPDSHESEWVERELLFAQRVRKPIFPLLLRGEEFPLLITTQYVDVSNGQLPPESFYTRLGRIAPPKKEVIPPQPKKEIKGPTPTPAPAARSRSMNWPLVGGIAGGLLLAIFLGSVIFSAIGGGDDEPTSSLAEAADIPVALPSPTNLPELLPTPTSTREPPVVPPALTSTITDLRTTITAADGAPMVLVPAGPFTMGSDADVALAECQKFQLECQRSWFEDEEPVRRVTLDAFYIDQYEVTNARYAACVEAGACDPPAETSSWTQESYYGNPEYDDFPVIYMSWEQARSYCEWRGDRLPTEAEWEKAARGTDGRIYPWGNTFEGNRLNFCDTNCYESWANKDYDDGYADTAPVGSYPNGVSPYGMYDMAGNVWEWVADWYDADYYATAPSHNPPGPDDGERKVVRGGSWYLHDYGARSATRLTNEPGRQSIPNGFRCAADAPE
jgi:formylglycine-generating enzyme required for sulfatase activity